MADFPYPLGVLGPSLPDERDWQYPAVPGAADLPPTKFLPTKEATFQGSQNSCLSHTATQLMEDDVWLRQGIRTDLSIPFIHYEGRKIHGWQNQNQGMWFRDAINVTRKLGVPPSVLMPYDPKDWSTPPDESVYDVAYRNRSPEFYSVFSAFALQQAINDGHPIGICVTVHENAEAFSKTGIWDHPNGAQKGAHAMEVDGYTTDPSITPDGKQTLWFLLKNWWSGWGKPHPLKGSDSRFDKHVISRCWIHSSLIDARSTFDMYSILRFPLEQ